MLRLLSVSARPRLCLIKRYEGVFFASVNNGFACRGSIDGNLAGNSGRELGQSIERTAVHRRLLQIREQLQSFQFLSAARLLRQLHITLLLKRTNCLYVLRSFLAKIELARVACIIVLNVENGF